jgi:hypothetical protein
MTPATAADDRYHGIPGSYIQGRIPSSSGAYMLLRKSIVAVAALAIACSGEPQEPDDGLTVRLERPSCRSCRIVAETIAFIGDSRDTIAVSEEMLPARDSRGRFYVRPARGASSIYAFGPDGRLMTEFGRAGKGPGELSRILSISVGAGDSLFVFENTRVHVFSPEYEHVRQFAVDFPLSEGIFTSVLKDGSIVTTTGERTFVVISSDGKAAPERTLERSDAVPCPMCGPRMLRVGIDPGTLWSSPMNKYAVDQHDREGRLLQRFVRVAWWAPDWGTRKVIEDQPSMQEIMDELTRSRFLGVRQSADSLLWTHVAALEDDNNSDLQQMLVGLMNTPDNQSGIPDAVSEILNRFSTHVEAIDPNSKELLASAVYPGIILPLADELSAQFAQDPLSGLAWRIIRFRLERD